jgi:hypothetical protein
MPAGYFQNPYANTGSAAGDFVNAFIQTDKTQGQGYLQGTQAMADIEGKQITNAAAEDEMMRKRKVDDIDVAALLKANGAPDDVIAQIMSGDFSPELQAMLTQASQQEQNIRLDQGGYKPVHGTGPGQGGDIAQQNAITEMFAQNPKRGVTDVRGQMAAIQGKYPPSGSASGFDLSSDAGVTELLGKADIPIYMEARQAGATIQEAIAAVATRRTGIDLNELLKAQPLELVKLIRDPQNAGRNVGTSVEQFNRQFQEQTQPWRNPQQNTTIGGVNAKWDPINKVWID